MVPTHRSTKLGPFTFRFISVPPSCPPGVQQITVSNEYPVRTENFVTELFIGHGEEVKRASGSRTGTKQVVEGLSWVADRFAPPGTAGLRSVAAPVSPPAADAPPPGPQLQPRPIVDVESPPGEEDEEGEGAYAEDDFDGESDTHGPATPPGAPDGAPVACRRNSADSWDSGASGQVSQAARGQPGDSSTAERGVVLRWFVKCCASLALPHVSLGGGRHATCAINMLFSQHPGPSEHPPDLAAAIQRFDGKDQRVPQNGLMFYASQSGQEQLKKGEELL